MMFASSAARKLILDLTERLQTMGSDDFMELRSQTQCKKEMFGRVAWVVWIYCVLQMIGALNRLLCRSAAVTLPS